MASRTRIGTRHPADGALAPVGEASWAKATWPLGAHFDGTDLCVAVYSRHASHVLLELYELATGLEASQDYWLQPNPTDNIWRGRIAGVKPGTCYAFRCWGPNWPFDDAWVRGNSAAGFVCDVDPAGNRFNPNKVLFDPYARELSHDKETPAMLAAGHDGGMYGTGGAHYKGVLRREFDTGPWVPKGIALAADKTSTGKRPLLPAERAAIYEAHVRGLTRHESASQLHQLLRGVHGFSHVVDIPHALRGTYAGAALMAPYLKALGFSTVEFLPVHESSNDTNPDTHSGGNYWGYMTFGYFAPDRRYAHDRSPGGPTREFKAMVRAFHEAGMEVYLDVVFNHTGEGGNWGQNDVTGFVSFGGFDAAEYYQLADNGYLVDGATGCGNQLNFSNPVAAELVIDSLTYWITEMGVDGFRFDLAPVLGRTPDATARENWREQRRFFQTHLLLDRIRDLGKRHRAEMIAEAWDMWGYEVGNFPAGWGEWNGRYRDAVRRFMKGDGNTQTFIDQVNGDWQSFNDQGGAQRSINFIVAHDGFTLMDLVSYNSKNNNAAWPFGPSDGGNDNNDSWDSDGDEALRRQRLRNFWTIQFFSRGVPMVVWGDEFGRTQNGNNNAYNVDGVGTWNNYAMAVTNRPNALPLAEGAYHDNFGTADCAPDCNPLFRFAAFVAGLRRDHRCLRQRKYGDFEMDAGEDVTYLFKKPDCETDLQPGDRALTLRIDGSEVGDHDFLLLINMHSHAVDFTVPASKGMRWLRIIDTAAWAEHECNRWPAGPHAAEIEGGYRVHPYAIAVLLEAEVV